MTTSIIMGALIPVFSIFASGGHIVNAVFSAIVACLGTAVTGINAYLSMKNYRDLWISYRNTRETLLQTVYCYLYNAGAFAQQKTQRQKDTLLVNLCEDALSKANGTWVTRMQSPSQVTIPPQQDSAVNL